MRSYLMFALVGCGGQTSEKAGHDSVDTELTYSADWDGVSSFLDDNCVSCHAEGGAAARVPFPSALQADLLFDELSLIVPEDAESSPFYRAVIDAPQIMPPNGVLPTVDTDHIRLWITSGARVDLTLVDLDGDGFGSAEDCDERDPLVNPAADEVCGDGIDNDCVDGPDDAGAVDAPTWYPDDDVDGFGDTDQPSVACVAPPGHTDIMGDCDDSDPRYNPNADESDCTDPNDYNCDESTGFADGDGDGFPACEDCDDSDGSINETTRFFEDGDDDGYGSSSSIEACVLPGGYAEVGGDCDDTRPTVFPGNPEFCDGLDNDCDTYIDNDASDELPFYPDNDGDGFGESGSSPVIACFVPVDHSDNDRDCNDGNPNAFPAATEDTNNGIDDNCDGQVDETVLTYSDIEVIWIFCEECHSDYYYYEDLVLIPNGYNNIVNQPSTQLLTYDLIEPGSPEDSYLYRKVTGSHLIIGGDGERMPPATYYDPLPTQSVERIERWILQGALR